METEVRSGQLRRKSRLFVQKDDVYLVVGRAPDQLGMEFWWVNHGGSLKEWGENVILLDPVVAEVADQTERGEVTRERESD